MVHHHPPLFQSIAPGFRHRLRGPGSRGSAQVFVRGPGPRSHQDPGDRHCGRDRDSPDLRIQKQRVPPGWLLRQQWIWNHRTSGKPTLSFHLGLTMSERFDFRVLTCYLAFWETTTSYQRNVIFGFSRKIRLRTPTLTCSPATFSPPIPASPSSKSTGTTPTWRKRTTPRTMRVQPPWRRPEEERDRAPPAEKVTCHPPSNLVSLEFDSSTCVLEKTDGDFVFRRRDQPGEHPPDARQHTAAHQRPRPRALQSHEKWSQAESPITTSSEVCGRLPGRHGHGLNEWKLKTNLFKQERVHFEVILELPFPY